MALADTASFSQLVVEVEFIPASGTFTTICGMRGATVNRSKNMDSDEVPDCDDDSLPMGVTKASRSIEVTVSGRGVWALSSGPEMMDWFYENIGDPAGQLNTRIRNSKVEDDGVAGDAIIESGLAILSSLSNEKEKGKKISADIEIEFITTPTITEKA